jgi:quinol monooxygenase YgiN
MMTAYNSVRMRVKPGREDQFLEMSRNMDKALIERLKANGLRKAAMVKTGERTYCFIGEWDSMEAMSTARPQMIAVVDSFRDTLEDLGGGLGLTDPVSGEAVVDYSSPN